MRQFNPYASPYPTDPTLAIIGDGLGRALFGDPAARQAQQQAEAEMAATRALMEQRQAAAGYDVARTRGVEQQNNASSKLVDLLVNGFAPPPPVQDMSTGGSLGDIVAGLGEGAALEEQGILPPPPIAAPTADDQLRALAPALFGTMGQMQGDKIDPNAMIGGLAALLGSDEFARRGMVAQGKTPGEEFALTADRADAIAKQGYDAKYREATDVATINNRDDVAVAEIGARSRVDAAGVRAAASGEVSGNKDYSKATDDARAAAQRLYPRARITQVERDPNSSLGKANPGSYHNSTKGAVDVAPIPGITFDQYVQGYRDAGYPVLEAKNEVGAGRSAHATGDHWHVVLGKREKLTAAEQKAAGGAGGEPTTAKAIPKYAKTELDAMADAAANAAMPASVRGNAAKEQRWRTIYRSWAGKYFQRTGDVNQVPELLRTQSRAIVAAYKQGSGGPTKKAAPAKAKVDLKKKYGLE